MNVLCLTDPNIHPDLLSVGTCLTSYFADVILIQAIRGYQLAKNVDMICSNAAFAA